LSTAEYWVVFKKKGWENIWGENRKILERKIAEYWGRVADYTGQYSGGSKHKTGKEHLIL
jgi:hypothetical protein